MVAGDDSSETALANLRSDPEAFDVMVRSHQRMIYSLAYRMTGSESDAEDLAQETFIRAHRQLESFRGESSLGTWLYRIAVNLCLNWRERTQRREQLHRDWSEEQDARSPASDPQMAARVQDALLRLPSKQRAAIVLTVYDGLSHAEAARVLGCTEATVSWRVFAARAKLKRQLKAFNNG